MAVVSKLKSLIVENDSGTARLLLEKLHEQGQEGEIASSWDQTLELIKKQSFQLLFLDAPRETETEIFDLVEHIRGEKTQCPEVVLITDNPNLSIYEIHQMGACHLLRKPLNFEEVREVIIKFGRDTTTPRYDRVQINPAILGKLYGYVSVGGKKPYNIEVANIGRGGFFYEVPVGETPPTVGQIISFNIKLGMVPDCSFQGQGIVRWTRSSVTEIGAGVEFLTIPPESEALIKAFVELFRIRPFVPSSI